MKHSLGFTEWPFHLLPDEDFVKVWCGRRELEKQLDTIFSGVVRRPNFQIYLVYGDFGSGKTHSIRHMLAKYREKDKLLTSELEYDATIRTFIQLYKALMSRLDFGAISSWPSPPNSSWHDFLAFFKAMKSDDQEAATSAIRWLTGEEKGKKSLGTIGIRSPIDSLDTATRAFAELTKWAGKNKSAVTLFVDEFQQVDKLDKRWRENILDGFTKMVNSSPRHLCLVISFRLRMPMNILSIIPESLVQRFSGDPFIEFRNFSKEEAEEFMKCLFAKFRVNENSDPYFPYSHDAFQANLSFLQEKHIDYNPRSLMKIFGHTSNCFEDTNLEPPISMEFVKASLNSYLP
jgi:Cdc6-like AAA superfamily ATPase